jgi:hypothetical protein
LGNDGEVYGFESRCLPQSGGDARSVVIRSFGTTVKKVAKKEVETEFLGNDVEVYGFAAFFTVLPKGPNYHNTYITTTR